MRKCFGPFTIQESRVSPGKRLHVTDFTPLCPDCGTVLNKSSSSVHSNRYECFMNTCLVMDLRVQIYCAGNGKYELRLYRIRRDSFMQSSSGRVIHSTYLRWLIFELFFDALKKAIKAREKTLNDKTSVGEK